MGENFKIFKCNHCFVLPCFSVAAGRIAPIACVFGEQYEKPNWIETDKYEIAEKKKVVPDIPEVPPIPRSKEDDLRDYGEAFEVKKPDGTFKRVSPENIRVFKTRQEARDFLDNHIKPRKTPNCAVCRWRLKPFRGEIKDFPELNKAMNDYAICDAQAGRSVQNVYNNAECKALFEPAEDK